MGNNDIISTFKSRSENYNRDMTWLNKFNLVDPMIPDPFGNNLALDVCTGTGLLANYLFNKGWTTVASDISQEMIEKVNNNHVRVISDVCHLPFPDNSFDLIVCRQGLQYVNLEEAMRSLKRVSANELRIGHVTINDSIDYEFWKDFHIQASPGRKMVFVPGQIEAIIEKVGLKITDKKVIVDQSEIMPPLMYLPDDKRQQLISSILKQTDEFKERNGIRIIDSLPMRERRWEFFVCCK